jgi:hypothetical protein
MLQADEAGSATGTTVHGDHDDHFCIHVSFVLHVCYKCYFAG